MNEQSIFTAALDRAPGDRYAFLDEVCREDQQLRDRVGRLLRLHEKAGSFLESPATGPLPMDDESAAERIGSWIGPFHLKEQVGEGGFGIVYRAEQERPVRRKVALKVIKPGMDSRQVIARFEAERQALAMMDHPNIAKVLDAGTTEEGRPYFVMELVQGVPITEYCDQCSLTMRERLELFILVCQAVQHAHQQGIIHRDLKPTNVLVAMQDGRPTPKVIDFGVAKAVNQRLTEHSIDTGFTQLIGTPLYMSPEQAELSLLGVDTRTDIYSLGVLLYELLTGTTPFEKSRLKLASFDEMRRIIREEEPPLPSARISTLAAAQADTVAKRCRTDSRGLTETVRGDLDWIVMKALEKDRTRRYDSTGAFVRDVGRFLRDEPIDARPQSTLYRVRKFARRNKTMFVAATLAAIAILGGTVVSTWQAIRATAAYHESDQDSRRAIAAGKIAKREQQRAEKALVASQRSQAELALEKGQSLGGQGDTSLALLWMAQALKTAPENAVDLRRVIRVNLFAWTQELHFLRSMMPHLGRVDTVCVQPENVLVGSRLGNEGFLLYRWNTQTGEPLHAPLRRMRGMVTALRFDEQGDALAAGYLDGRVELMEVHTGKVRELPMASKSGPVTALVFSPQGDKLLIAWSAHPVPASAALDENSRQFKAPGFVQVVEASSGKPTLEQPIRHDELVWTADFSRDGNLFVTESAKWLDVQSNGQVRFWNVNGEEVRKPLSHPGAALVIALNSKGDQLLTGHWDSQARLWSLSQEGASLAKTITCNGPVGAAAFHPLDPHAILLGDYGGTLRLWNLAADRSIGPMLRHPHYIRCARFSANGQYVLCGARDTAHLWEVSRGATKTVSASYSPPGGPLSIDHAKKQVLVQDDDGLVRLRGALTGDAIGQAALRTGPVMDAALSNDGRLAATIETDGAVRLWDLKAGEVLKDLLFTEPAFGVAISPNSATVAVGYFGDVALLWDSATGEVKATLHHQSHSGPVFSVEYSPDGTKLLTGGADGLARLWDVQTGEEVKQFPPIPFVSGADFSPDGTRVVICGGGEGARVWQLDGASPIGLPLRHEGPTVAAKFSSNGEMVLTGGTDGAARLWDVATGRQLGPTVKHNGHVDRIWFWPDGQTLATAAMSKGAMPGGRLRDTRYWAAPRPLKGTDSQIDLWVRAITGMQLDHNGDMRLLDPDSWKSVYQTLRNTEHSELLDAAFQ